MSTTHDDATTWRDLAGELTDIQRDTFERLEREFGESGIPPTVTTERLLEYARADVETNIADNAYSDVPAPAGATSIGRWEKNLKRDGWSRSIEWRKFDASPEFLVIIDGSQQCDGKYTCDISVYGGTLDDIKLANAGAARRLMAVLAEAANLLDQLLSVSR
jgi:hypothetical protein